MGQGFSGVRTISKVKRIVRVLSILFVVGVLLVGGSGAGLFYWGKAQFTGEGPAAVEGSETVVMLPHGTGLKQIAARLEKADLISDARIFEIGVRLEGNGNKLKAGEYGIPSGASMKDIAAIIISGKSILYKLTAAEGLTSKQILRVIAQDSVLVGEITLDPGEGELLPQTYLFTRGMSRDELINKMRSDMQKVLVPLWDERADGLPFDTMEEAIILASIVEKETGIAEERPRIAAVFVNRLNRGIRLQSDPTIIYGLTGGEPLGHGLRVSELKKPNKYNTYQIDGLPPTPIANPGIDSLRAVLNPPSTNELFFVADGTGGHVFAKTNREHQRNVAKWRKVERERRSK